MAKVRVALIQIAFQPALAINHVAYLEERVLPARVREDMAAHLLPSTERAPLSSARTEESMSGGPTQARMPSRAA